MPQAAHLAEGLRNELYGIPLATKTKITVLYPGYIASDMNEKQVADACVPALPWAPLSVVMKHAPLPVLTRLMKLAPSISERRDADDEEHCQDEQEPDDDAENHAVAGFGLGHVHGIRCPIRCSACEVTKGPGRV